MEKDGDPEALALPFQALLLLRMEEEVVVFHFLFCPPLGVLREALLEFPAQAHVLLSAAPVAESDSRVCQRAEV